LNPQPHGLKQCAPPTELDSLMLFLYNKTVDNTTKLGAKICGVELGATSTPRRRVVPTQHVPRRHNLWRRAVLPRRHRLWRRAKGTKIQLNFFRIQTCIFFRKMVKIQKIRSTRGGSEACVGAWSARSWGARPRPALPSWHWTATPASTKRRPRHPRP
jgi:hypothetical protein